MSATKEPNSIDQLLEIMAALRGPEGCPWDREQNHKSLTQHAIEEVYELIDAIEADDDVEMLEELGDILLQVVFHCQLANERGAFDFDQVAQRISDKLIRRHPHVFGDSKVSTVDGVWDQWEKIKREEKAGTDHERTSVLDGIPNRLPALMRAEKLLKKAKKAGLQTVDSPGKEMNADELGENLFKLVAYAQSQGWHAEELLRRKADEWEMKWRKLEQLRD